MKLCAYITYIYTYTNIYNFIHFIEKLTYITWFNPHNAYMMNYTVIITLQTETYEGLINDKGQTEKW
jgi:hypothetical protein